MENLVWLLIWYGFSEYGRCTKNHITLVADLDIFVLDLEFDRKLRIFGDDENKSEKNDKRKDKYCIGWINF